MMGRQIKGLLYFFIADVRYSLFIFWTILLSILVVSLIVAYFLMDIEKGMMSSTLTAPMYVYCAILGFLTVKESIPFSIKMGATRRNLFISLGIFFLGLSFIKAIAASTIQVIIDYINPKIGIDNFYFLHLSFFTNDTWFTRILIDTSIMFFFFSFMFMIGLLFYKYGLAGGGSAVGLLAILMITGFAQGWLSDFFIDIFSSIDLMFFGQLFVVSIVIYILSILLLRKITIVKTK